MSPNGTLTEAQVKVMIADQIVAYERHYGEVRHRENTGKFDRLFEWIYKLDGAILFAKVVGSIIAFMCAAILGFLTYFATHHNTSQLSVQHPTTVAQTQYSDMK
jgi:hypothetical protein